MITGLNYIRIMPGSQMLWGGVEGLVKAVGAFGVAGFLSLLFGAKPLIT